MAGLVPAIHVFAELSQSKTGMSGTSPGMTIERFVVVFSMNSSAWR